MVVERVKTAAFHAFPHPLQYSIFQSCVTSLVDKGDEEESCNLELQVVIN
jgi:hypothetical protein